MACDTGLLKLMPIQGNNSRSNSTNKYSWAIELMMNTIALVALDPIGIPG